MTTELSSEAKVYRTQLMIPTYELLQDDLNPIFDKSLDPYPYTLQNFPSGRKVDQSYEVIIVENEYLKLTVIPSLGGRLYSAIDKRTNKEFLYRNSVIRPRMIGTRGAWFAGGIEYNFPISHSPTTMDRVNCTTCEYPDGSVSVIFGNIEQISYMNWKVELKLYPGKAYIEQNVRLFNPTSIDHKYYFWTNAAVEYDAGLKLIYPFDWCINLDNTYVKWPLYDGMDCRDPKQIRNAYETFGKLRTGNFFGIYNPSKDYGVVHYANRKIVKGAKFFIWGNDDHAAAWNRSLTDDDSQYIEIQSGPFESQMVYKFLKPHQEMKWSEYWYPVFGMNEFKHAERQVALDFERTAEGIEFRMLAAETLKNCSLVVSDGKETYSQELDLTPEQTRRIVMATSSEFSMERLTIDLYCGSDHIVNIGTRREFTDEYPDHALYEDSRVNMLNDRPEDHLKQGQWRESLGFAADAITHYTKHLEDHPSCTTTLTRLGGLYLKSMQYDKAEQCYRTVLQYDNRNSQARYMLAVTFKETGDSARARRLFMDIAVDADWFRASVIELIKIDLRLGYYHEARMLSESLQGDYSFTSFLASVAYRKDGQLGKAEEAVRSGSHSDEHLLAESFIANPTEEAKRRLLEYTNGDESVLLPIALNYLDIGCWEDAETLLGCVTHASIKTRLTEAYIKQMHHKIDDHAMIRAIQDESIDYAFFKERPLVKLLMSLRSSDESGRADYLAGSFYYAMGRKEDALDLFLNAYTKGLRYTVLLRNIGYAYFRDKKDLLSAELYFDEDVKLNGSTNADSLIYLDRIYAETNDQEKRKALIPFMKQAANRSLVLLPLVAALRDSGQEDQALMLLETEEFENWEGQENSGPCYRDTILHMAKREIEQGNFAKAHEWMQRVNRYPAKLNYGESSSMARSELRYYQGLIYAGMGDAAASIEQYRQGYEELYDPLIRKTEKSKSFSMKCYEQWHYKHSFI